MIQERLPSTWFARSPDRAWQINRSGTAIENATTDFRY